MSTLSMLDHRTRKASIEPALAASGRYLSVLSEDGPRLIALQERLTHIGRGLTADIRIDDHRVSRLQAIIVQHAHGARLLTGRSLSETLVNGRRAVAAELSSGDEITLGPVVMRYLELPAEVRVTRQERERRTRARSRSDAGHHSGSPGSVSVQRPRVTSMAARAGAGQLQHALPVPLSGRSPRGAGSG